MKLYILLPYLFISLLSFDQTENNLIVIDPDKHQNMSVDGELDPFDIISSEKTIKGDPDKPHDDVLYVFDFDNMICDFFRFGELVSSVDIIDVQERDGLIYVDCDDTNIRTGGRIITHYVLNPKGKKNVPHMIYHFYWDDIDKSVAEVTLSLK